MPDQAFMANWLEAWRSGSGQLKGYAIENSIPGDAVDLVKFGTDLRKPPPKNPGRLYFATDILNLLIDDGKKWQSVGGGIVGPPGPTGATGPTGPQGPPGPPPQSVYVQGDNSGSFTLALGPADMPQMTGTLPAGTRPWRVEFQATITVPLNAAFRTWLQVGGVDIQGRLWYDGGDGLARTINHTGWTQVPASGSSRAFKVRYASNVTGATIYNDSVGGGDSNRVHVWAFEI